MNQLNVGEATLHRVEEMIDNSFSADVFFPDFDPARIADQMHWLAPQHYNAETGKLALAMHAWVVKTGRHTVLIDTCVGNDKERMPRAHWHHLNTPFLENLRATGTAPEDIDFVMCSHLHPDHVGWNTRLADGRWVPTFPNAKYLLGRIEYEHWRDNDQMNEVRRAAIQDSVLPIVESGQAVFVDDGHQIDDSFTVKLTPGHTPGHAEMQLRSAGKQGYFVGDAIHHPMQIYCVDWSTSACSDMDMARVTRRNILERAVENNALLLPAHFMAPHCGHVHEQGDGFRFEWGA